MKVVSNGLWAKEINELEEKLKQSLEDAFEEVRNARSSVEQEFVLYTGREGQRQFRQALEVEAEIEIPAAEELNMDTEVLTGFSQGSTMQSYEEIQKRLLDNGEIDILTYLDRISNTE